MGSPDVPPFVNLIFRGRSGGKTYEVMTEIHEWFLAGRLSEVLLVVSDMQEAYFWLREWRARFPAISIPAYVSIQDTSRIRNRRFSKVYVEDIHDYEEGIHDEKFQSVWPCLVESEDPEVVLTCGYNLLNDRTHSVIMTKGELMSRRLAKVREQREREAEANPTRLYDYEREERIASAALREADPSA